MKQKIINRGAKGLGLILFALSVFGLVSATESESSGKVEKVLVDIKPLEGEVWLVTNEDVARLLYKNYKSKLKNQSIVNLDLIQIEKVIEKSEFVKDAQVYIDARETILK